MTKEQKEQIKSPAFIRGKKAYETIGNDEIGTITIERKGSLTPAEKVDLETLLNKANISKSNQQKDFFEISERIAIEKKEKTIVILSRIENRDEEILSLLTNEETKKLFGSGMKDADARTQESEIENSIYACIILRSRVEEFQTILPENLLDPNHDLFLPYPLLELVAEFCYRELHHWKEKKNFEEDDLKSVPR